MGELRKRPVRLVGVAAALALLVAPTSAVAQDQEKSPVTVPALTNWTPENGSYQYDKSARLVADSPAGRRVADTLADDLRAAGHGTVPVVVGGARTGDIVIDVRPATTSLGAEGY